MGDLTKNLSRSEFACKCGCGFDTVDFALAQAVQKIRDHYGRKVTVNSGCRCKRHNKNEGGGEKSQHLLGRAADLVVEGISPGIVQDWVDNNLHDFSMGVYDSFTHLDSRSGGPARW
jgi:uncharacterized protein YcbK (DUF882 family)